jgi:hypothetical protein
MPTSDADLREKIARPARILSNFDHDPAQDLSRISLFKSPRSIVPVFVSRRIPNGHSFLQVGFTNLATGTRRKNHERWQQYSRLNLTIPGNNTFPASSREPERCGNGRISPETKREPAGSDTNPTYPTGCTWFTCPHS